MKLKELQRWILKNDEEDSWWVAVDGSVLDNVMALPDISRFKEENLDRQVSVLHVSRAEDENAEWILFERLDPKKVKLAQPAGGGRYAVGPKPTVKVPARADEPAPAPEEPSQSQATPQTEPVLAPPPTAESDSLKADIKALKGEILKVKAELNSFRGVVDELKQPILEAHKLLEERERFLEIGENALFDKAQKQEVLQTELEQLREELNKRERYIEEREDVIQSQQAAG